MSKASLERAKQVKNDEFYTLMDTIISEVHHYKDQFKDKVVLLNCDDPDWSNFWKVAKMIFKDYGIKKVVSTHYNPNGPSYKLELVRGRGGNPVEKEPIALKGHGDFADEEGRALMAEADIVLTNPPFSLFRKYIAQLIEMEKKFLIIGNFMSLSYKEVYNYYQNNQLWLGQSPRTIDFKLSNEADELYKGGTKTVNACWFTNLPNKRRNQVLRNGFNIEESPYTYETYENYDAINIGHVHKIPDDYEGVMGVPLTFVEKFNPKQFEIVQFRKGHDGKDLRLSEGDSCPFRILIRCKKTLKQLKRSK